MLASVGGVLNFDSLQGDYGYNTEHATRTSSLAVGVQQLGAFVACFAAWPLTDRVGRSKALILLSAVFCIGAVIQTVNTHSLPAFYVARVITSLSLGAATVVVPVPMFNGGMMLKELRGRVGSFFQLFFTLVRPVTFPICPDFSTLGLFLSRLQGILVSYWVDYAVARTIPGSESREWQIPVGLQLVPAALLGISMLTLKESTRWLAKKRRHEEAWERLKWVRGSDSQETQDETEEIRVGVENEARAMEGVRFVG